MSDAERMKKRLKNFIKVKCSSCGERVSLPGCFEKEKPLGRFNVCIFCGGDIK